MGIGLAWLDLRTSPASARSTSSTGLVLCFSQKIAGPFRRLSSTSIEHPLDDDDDSNQRALRSIRQYHPAFDPDFFFPQLFLLCERCPLISFARQTCIFPHPRRLTAATDCLVAVCPTRLRTKLDRCFSHLCRFLLDRKHEFAPSAHPFPIHRTHHFLPRFPRFPRFPRLPSHRSTCTIT